MRTYILIFVLLAFAGFVHANQTPTAPTGVIQYKADCLTSLAAGAQTTEGVVCMKANISDPDVGDQIRLQAELATGTFSNSPVYTSSYCVTPCQATLVVSGLAVGAQYKWQVRTQDVTGATGSWTTFNGGQKAFEIVSLPSTPSIVSMSSDTSASVNVTAQAPQTATQPISYWFQEMTGNSGSSSSTAWITTPVFGDTGLVANTRYTYQVKIKDKNGNESPYSSTVSKVTLTPAPTNFKGTLSTDNTMRFSVDPFPNDMVGSAGYYFWRQGKTSGWTQSNFWEDSGLECERDYVWYVKQRNTEGVETSSVSTTKKTNVCTSVQTLGLQKTTRKLKDLTVTELSAEVTKVTQLL